MIGSILRWACEDCDGIDCHHLIHTLCRGTFTACDEMHTTNRFKFLLLYPRSQLTSMLRADAVPIAYISSHCFQLLDPKLPWHLLMNETGLNDGCIIIDKSPTAAHTANWCARFSHLCHRQSWSKQSSPMQRRLWQAACLLQQPLIYQFEILCPLHCVFKKWLNHTMSLPQFWIPMFVNIWSIHSFEERLSGDWKFCHQLFAMYPCITIISTTQHSGNKCLMFALCSTKLFPAFQCMITVCCEQNTQHAKWLNPWMNQITMTIAHSANWCAYWILAGS
jgi:hypothetical protein